MGTGPCAQQERSIRERRYTRAGERVREWRQVCQRWRGRRLDEVQAELSCAFCTALSVVEWRTFRLPVICARQAARVGCVHRHGPDLRSAGEPLTLRRSVFCRCTGFPEPTLGHRRGTTRSEALRGDPGDFRGRGQGFPGPRLACLCGEHLRSAATEL